MQLGTLRQLICQIDHLWYCFFYLSHDSLQKLALLRVGHEIQSGHILCGIKDHRKLLSCEKEAGEKDYCWI